jgi:PTH1 family peptidyl-tRNA hydrolase
VLIVGLGNVGKEYSNTRHNVGFMCLDSLVNTLQINTKFSESKNLEAKIVAAKIGDAKVILVKPTTYMNQSGRSIRKIVNYYKVSPEHIIVIHDDLDITLGKFKIAVKKGPRGHNGIKSIEENLKTEKFTRLRIGVENREEKSRKKISGKDYVLSKFSQGEVKILEEEVFTSSSKKLLGLLNTEYSP